MIDYGWNWLTMVDYGLIMMFEYGWLFFTMVDYVLYAWDLNIKSYIRYKW